LKERTKKGSGTIVKKFDKNKRGKERRKEGVNLPVLDKEKEGWGLTKETDMENFL